MDRLSRRTILAGAATLALPARLRAQAAYKPALVELFTSEGCSSCPAADAVLSALAKDRDVVVLAYHVDYWDYLGWKDTLGSAENTARQYAYAKALGRRSVYTPQAIVNGRRHCNGADRTQITQWVEGDRNAGAAPSVDVQLDMRGKKIHLSVGSAPLGPREVVHVLLALFRSKAEVEIERGENAGKKMVYANAVTGLKTLGMWDRSPMEIDWPESGLVAAHANGCAVILQSITATGQPSAVLGTALMYRYGA